MEDWDFVMLVEEEVEEEVVVDVVVDDVVKVEEMLEKGLVSVRGGWGSVVVILEVGRVVYFMFCVFCVRICICVGVWVCGCCI